MHPRGLAPRARGEVHRDLAFANTNHTKCWVNWRLKQAVEQNSITFAMIWLGNMAEGVSSILASTCIHLNSQASKFNM